MFATEGADHGAVAQVRPTELELIDRCDRRMVERRIRQARFPVRLQSLDSFDFKAIAS